MILWAEEEQTAELKEVIGYSILSRLRLPNNQSTTPFKSYIHLNIMLTISRIASVSLRLT